MEEYKISSTVLQDVLNYLAGRPYVEVFQLVGAIQKTLIEGKEDRENKKE